MEVKAPGFPARISDIKPGECFVITQGQESIVAIKTMKPVNSEHHTPHWCVVLSGGQPMLVPLNGVTDKLAVRLSDVFIQISGIPNDISSKGLGWPGSISVSTKKESLLVVSTSDGDWYLVNLISGEISDNYQNDSLSSFLAWQLIRLVNDQPEVVCGHKAKKPA